MRRWPWLTSGTLIGALIGFLIPVKWHGYDTYADFAMHPIQGAMIGCVVGIVIDSLRSLLR